MALKLFDSVEVQSRQVEEFHSFPPPPLWKSSHPGASGAFDVTRRLSPRVADQLHDGYITQCVYTSVAGMIIHDS